MIEKLIQTYGWKQAMEKEQKVLQTLLLGRLEYCLSCTESEKK